MNFNGVVVFFLATAVAVTAADEPANKGTIFDLLPMASQIKALAHLAFGDTEGFDRTNKNFVDHGLLVSQARSAWLLAKGEFGKAVDEQAQFINLAGETIVNTPVIGHVASAAEFLVDKAVIQPASFLASKLLLPPPPPPITANMVNYVTRYITVPTQEEIDENKRVGKNANVII